MLDELREDHEEEGTEDLSIQIGVDDDFDIEGVHIPKGPRLPRSVPDLQGLTDAQIAVILGGLSDQEIEDLFNKNTESFRCLAQILISRSSLMRHILYHFPELTDPGIDEAFDFVEVETVYDSVGTEKYQSLCREMNVAPISRVLNSLETDTLNLKYYGLSDKQFKVLASSIMFNPHIKYLILQDNWLSPESAFCLGEMLRENNCIEVLNLRECRLGPAGIRNCMDGFSLNQSVQELDLSFNDLADEGIELLIEAVKDNIFIQKLNLGHNHLGELSGKLIGDWFKEGNNIDFLDLSWNDLYEGKALKHLCDGLVVSEKLTYLNLSWNGIGKPEMLAPIIHYLKRTEILEHLDLSFNRLTGKLILMLKAGLNANNSLISVNLGFNLITPDDAIQLTSVFKKTKPLEYMDLQNVFVNKEFIPIWKKLTSMGKNIRIEGIVDNYTIVGHNKTKVVFDRCRYLAQKPKKKKLKKDFGSDFIWNLPDAVVDKVELTKMLRKSKIKLDADLVDFLGDTFAKKKKRIELKAMRDSYLELYPDTQPPPPPKKAKKSKKKKGKKRAKSVDESPRPTTEEKAIGTESSMMERSSIVTGKINIDADNQSGKRTLSSRGEPSDKERFVSTVDLDRAESIEDEMKAYSMSAESKTSKMRSARSLSAKSLSARSKSATSKSNVAFKDEDDDDDSDDDDE